MITNETFVDNNVAGGWTEHDTVARRVLETLWAQTNAFAIIERYRADVLIDYEIWKEAIAKLAPGDYALFTFYVYDCGTHTAVLAPEASEEEIEHYVTTIKCMESFFSSTGPLFYTGVLRRSEGKIDSYNGARYGTDRYELMMDAHVTVENHERINHPAISLGDVVAFEVS